MDGRAFNHGKIGSHNYQHPPYIPSSRQNETGCSILDAKGIRASATFTGTEICLSCQEKRCILEVKDERRSSNLKT